MRYAKVVDDDVALTRRNDLADLVLDVLEDALGRFDAGRRRGADVELDLSAVDLREEIAADKRQHDTPEREHERGDDRDDEPPLEQHRERAHVSSAKPLEPTLERLVKARKPVSRTRRCAVVFPLEQQTDDDRRQRTRKGIGREHGEHDREPQRGEQEFCRPFEKHHRCEHAADRQRRDHGRHRDAGGAVQRRRRKIVA